MDNLAGFTNQGVYTPIDALIVGGFDTVTRAITLAGGQGKLPRGSVLGKVSVGAPSVAPKAGGNTGNGTLTLDATSPELVNAKAGVYQVRAIAAGANSATFRVTDPAGSVLGDVSFNGAGSTGTFSDRIKFAIADGSTDFVVGDGFDVTVAAGSGSYMLSALAAIDGSATPSVILANDEDTTLGPVATTAYFKAVVDENACTYGAGMTPALARDPLRGFGVQLQSSITR